MNTSIQQQETLYPYIQYEGYTYLVDIAQRSHLTGFLFVYVALVLNYSMLKMYLVGFAGYYTELNDPIVIKMIYSFGKAVEYNNTFLKNVFEALQKNGYTSLGHMAILIKN